MYVHRVNHTVILLVPSRSSEVAVYFLSSDNGLWPTETTMAAQVCLLRRVCHSFIHSYSFIANCQTAVVQSLFFPRTFAILRITRWWIGVRKASQLLRLAAIQVGWSLTNKHQRTTSGMVGGCSAGGIGVASAKKSCVNLMTANEDLH